MYLSEASVDLYAVRNPYEVHRLIWRLFPDRPDDERPFLFRVGEGRRGGTKRILIQSNAKPARSAEGIHLLSEPKMYRPALHAGQPLRFLLRANPVKRLKEARCRVPLVKEEHQRAWLARKLDGAARLMDVRMSMREILYFYKKNKAGKIVTVTYEGFLDVVDPGRLMALLKTGIGPAKGFGCGLLSLARV